MKTMLLGNQAIAYGALDAGVSVLAAYPGTPSTEIAETAAGFETMQTQWAANEIVAAEVAMGASVSGARAVCCMKHVGLNVASEVLFTGAYTGVNGAMVFVVADDPGMHSSQNEQDTRLIAAAAHVPVLEPADSQQAYDFMRLAVLMSEACDMPTIVRMTTRTSHARSVVMRGEAWPQEKRAYEKNVRKYVMAPANAAFRKTTLQDRLMAAAEFAAEHGLNTVHKGSGKIGIICAGIVSTYVKEAVPEADVLQLGLVNPLNEKEILAFAQSVETLYVAEELEPHLLNAVRSFGIVCEPIDTSYIGELSVRKIRQALGLSVPQALPAFTDLAPRPPMLCAGCPHRAVFYVLSKLKATVFGDIGCYTLGSMPPLSAMDTTLCMGASIGMAHGAELGMGRDFARKSVAVIGDSTFFHSGLSGLASAVYNQANTTVVIVDNGTTGMTGHQDNPATGKTLGGEEVTPIKIEEVCAALGARSVRVVDPLNIDEMETAIRQSWEEDGVSVVISRRPCVMIVKKREPAFKVDPDKCIACGRCIGMGCPALLRENKRKAMIISDACIGCDLCARVC
ncbi:MAG: indolepyruvate ferredoxin oxidoreductase subunit alpha, partial [Clostridia bacterium]|nr:indolepyruvate ferredoxin oxidoreductase subunit alpha [Clostridia bacterium]